MSLIAAVRTGGSVDVLNSLRTVCDSQGLDALSARLGDLADLMQWDMREVEQQLQHLPQRNDIVNHSARHLLDLGGKRLRPMCVALAARVGSGFNSEAQTMALAVELVHCATLLHDDVVDVGQQRRGSPTARTVYGNAASIFAGDWLLVEALRRVHEAKVPRVLERLLGIIDEMIAAEALQLERRGRVDIDEKSYFSVVEGKTAALFRWAMFAGGKAAGLSDEDCATLEGYGLHLGVAFQLVDDVLDYDGDAEQTGKAMFTDLREGKITHPLIVGLQREPGLAAAIERVVRGMDEPSRSVQREIFGVLRQVGAFDETRRLALAHADSAVRVLEALPESRARSALLTVAHATVHREQ